MLFPATLRTLFLTFSLVVLGFSPSLRGQNFARTLDFGTLSNPGRLAVVDSGNFVMATFFSNGNGGLVHSDPSGNPLWVNEYPGAYIVDVAVAIDGNFIACGSYEGDPWIMKVRASDGQVLWSETTTTQRGTFRAIAVNPDNTMALIGSIRDGSFDSILFAYVSSDTGFVIRQMMYGSPGVYDQAQDITRLPDGRYIITGTVDYLGQYDVYIAKAINEGGLLWVKFKGGPGREGYLVKPSVTTLTSGRVVVSAMRNFDGTSDSNVWVFCMDSDGQTLWEKEIDLGVDYGVAVSATEDDGFVLTGYTSPDTPTNSSSWLMSMSSSGTIRWQRAYGGLDNELSTDVAWTPSGILTSGQSSSFAGGESHAWIRRTDEVGDIGRCCDVVFETDGRISDLSTPETASGTQTVFLSISRTERPISPQSRAYGEAAQCATNAGAWTNLQEGTTGTEGLPCLSGVGSLRGATFATHILSNARRNTVATMVLGLSRLDLPLFGGTLVPAFDYVFLGLPTGGGGKINLPSIWPSGIPGGFTFYMQYLILDPVAASGYAFSNAIQGVTP